MHPTVFGSLSRLGGWLKSELIFSESIFLSLVFIYVFGLEEKTSRP